MTTIQSDINKRLIAGEKISVTLENGNTGIVFFDPHYHAENDSAIVFEVHDGWTAEFCYPSFTEAICGPCSNYLESSFLTNAKWEWA